MTSVGIVATGVANLASVNAAFARLGIEAHMIDTPDEIQWCERIVLPGVGAFGAAMEQLKKLNLADVLRERITIRRPTLAICLGMQLLFDSSYESPGVQGLGIIPARVQKINAPDMPVPQMGWNNVVPQSGFTASKTGYAYFANSYAAQPTAINSWQVATFDYGGEYIAALQSGGVLACQFHPELSGAWGQSLIQNWLESASC